jgi:hypothetical protein
MRPLVAVSDEESAKEVKRKKPVVANTDLAKILEANLTREMTPAQKETQRRSFVYGNTKIDNDAVTRDTVDKAADSSTDAAGTRPSLFCRWCGQPVNEHRVYFGVVGPFCNVTCRDEYANDLQTHHE